jgi:hypothetical protein
MPRKASDHVLTVVKAGLNVIPFVGGSLASLVGDYVPSSTQRSIERTVELLGEQLTVLQDRIDVEAVDKDEFSELFKSCYLVAVRTHREEKLRAAAGLLANLLLKPEDPAKLTYDEIDHFVRCLDTLSIGAITLLGTASSIMRTSNTGVDRLGMWTFRVLQTRLRPEMEHDLALGLVGELSACNLLRIEAAEEGLGVAYAPVQLTKLGQRFVSFVEGRMPDLMPELG